MFKKLIGGTQKLGEILELVLALIIVVALIGTIINFIPELVGFIKAGATPDSFLVILEEIFSIVIGIEFLKMLSSPSMRQIIEVVIFLLARHMIIAGHSAFDNLLSVIGIALLFVVYFAIKGRKNGVLFKREKEQNASSEIESNKKSDA